MIMAIYQRALAFLMKKPVRLWGLSLLGCLLTSLGSALFGLVPGVSISIALLFSTAMTMVYLHGYRGDEVRAVDLFATFRDWATIKRVLCGMGWMLLWIFLWCLIPIVGIIFGIIRCYEYRLTPYILMLEPDVKPTEAIKLSKERTQGWKGKMFGADILVFVLYAVALIVLSLLGRIPFVGWLFNIILALFTICFYILIPLFIGMVHAAFYEEIQKWGSYPGREAYAPAGAYPPPPGYDPSQPYGQQYPPQGYQQQPEQPVWQQPGQPAWQQPQPTWQQPQQPVWQQPQQPVWQQPGQPAPQPEQQPEAAWQPPEPEQPVWQQPQQPEPTWQPPEPPQPMWQPPEPPAAPDPAVWMQQPQGEAPPEAPAQEPQTPAQE